MVSLPISVIHVDPPAKITSLKHAVPKQDKKRKKEVQNEIELLEKQLKERHDKETYDLETAFGSTNVEESPVEGQEEESDEGPKEKKLTKTQKQRVRVAMQ